MMIRQHHSNMMPYTREAYQLFHNGVQALAEVEANGLRVDEDYLRGTIKRMKRKIAHMQKNLNTSDVMKQWRRTFGPKTKINSNVQLGKVLFEIMGFPPPEETGSGRYKTDEGALSSVDHPFVWDYLKLRKYQKALSTSLVGLQNEIVDGYVHPFFNLHLARTYRSSSDSFNFQNIPIRDPWMAELIRRSFIARSPHRQLVEIDYSGIEVWMATCYHKDPTMIAYIKDPTKDMHRDMAMECYQLPQAEVNKPIRYCGKNMFVFPQFYGDWYLDCARSLWEATKKMKLVTVSGIPLRRHLANKGIRELGDLDPKAEPRLGTFEAHIKSVEQHFWNKRFPIYNQWKKDWYEAYKRLGWFISLTGFICQGFMKRNEVINYPVQGSAFHCLLWALIRLVRRELKRHKMKTLVVGQIHDSIVSDVPTEELEDYIGLAREVMVNQLMKHWDWICVPIDIEVEVSPVGGSWADKEVWK